MTHNMFDRTGIERLENRLMMAGDVTANLAGGDLIVNGDNSSNEVAIRATDQAGEYVVEGLNGTTINGQSSVTIGGVNDDVRINLRNGDNVLLLTAEGPDGEQSFMSVPDDLQIRTGDGNDSIVLDNVFVGDDAAFRMGAGDDTLVTFQSFIQDELRVDTGSGADFVGLDTTDVGGRMRINLQSGNDIFVMFDSTVGERSDVNMGSGDDFFGTSDAQFGDDLRLNGGGGNDLALDNDSVFDQDVRNRSIETSADADPADISSQFENNTNVNAAINLIFAEGTGF